MKKFLALVAPALLVVPMVAHAQTLAWFDTLTGSLQDIVDLLVPLFIGIALVAFLFGLAKYIFAAGNEEAQANGRKIMVAGIIGLFVAVSIWGIITVLGTSLGINQGGTIPVPVSPTVAP